MRDLIDSMGNLLGSVSKETSALSREVARQLPQAHERISAHAQRLDTPETFELWSEIAEDIARHTNAALASVGKFEEASTFLDRAVELRKARLELLPGLREVLAKWREL